MDQRMLDLAEAMRFHDLNPPMLGGKLYFVADLSDYTQATLEAIEYLAQKTRDSCDFVNVGLTSLDKEQADALIDWDATLCFVNLERLDVEIAGILAEGVNILAFENLKEICPEVASELAKLNAILDISLDSISLDVANELIKHAHELRLKLLEPPSGQMLSLLSRHVGYRMHVTWERQAESAPWLFVPSHLKKVFIVPRFHKEDGKWFENVYIGDADFYPDELVSNDGIIEVL